MFHNPWESRSGVPLPLPSAPTSIKVLPTSGRTRFLKTPKTMEGLWICRLTGHAGPREAAAGGECAGRRGNQKEDDK